MDNFKLIDVFKNADMLMRKCVAAKPGEQVLIIADTGSEFAFVHALAGAALAVGAIPTITVMQEREQSGATLVIEKAVEAADVVFTVTNRSVVHSPSIRKALHEEKRIRVCTTIDTHMKGFTTAGANMDLDELNRITEKISNAIRGGKKLRFTSELGTDLTGIIEGMPVRAAGGLARNPGDLSCFPDGESWQAPREGTAEGVVVIDKNITLLGPISAPVKYTVHKGRVVNIEGGGEAAKLRDMIKGVKDADNIAEMAVGTNPMAKFIGEIMTDKHVLGSVHVAIGDNRIYGGNTSCVYHIDGVVSNATVEVDGKIIIEKGQLKI
jgi:leucyl aminopeptidase (aminopeptidase T)